MMCYCRAMRARSTLGSSGANASFRPSLSHPSPALPKLSCSAAGAARPCGAVECARNARTANAGRASERRVAANSAAVLSGTPSGVRAPQRRHRSAVGSPRRRGEREGSAAQRSAAQRPRRRPCAPSSPAAPPRQPPPGRAQDTGATSRAHRREEAGAQRGKLRLAGPALHRRQRRLDARAVRRSLRARPRVRRHTSSRDALSRRPGASGAGRRRAARLRVAPLQADAERVRQPVRPSRWRGPRGHPRATRALTRRTTYDKRNRRAAYLRSVPSLRTRARLCGRATARRCTHSAPAALLAAGSASQKPREPFAQARRPAGLCPSSTPPPLQPVAPRVFVMGVDTAAPVRA